MILRIQTIAQKNNPKWTQSRIDTIPNGQFRMNTISNGYDPEWTQYPNEHDFEWTRS